MGLERVLGVIPARLASTRFPGKVLEPLGGKPLLAHVFERLSSASVVDDVVIATDSPEVKLAAAAFGAPSVLVTEPCATGSDRVARAVAHRSGDVVVNLQADQPLIDPGDIDRVVERLLGAGDIDVTTLAYQATDADGFGRRDVVKVVTDANGRALYFSRAPIPSSRDGNGGNPLYLHHVGIYCFRRPALLRFAALPRTELEKRESLEQLRALEHGMTIGVVVTDRQSPGIDRAADLREAERLLAQRRGA